MNKLTWDVLWGMYLSGERIFEEYDLSEITLQDVGMFSSSFRRCVFKSTQFTNVTLNAIQFDDCVFEQTSFILSNMYACTFYGCTVKSVLLEDLEVERCYFDKVSFVDSILKGCGLFKVEFDYRCIFSNFQFINSYHKVGKSLRLKFVDTSLNSTSYEDTF